MDQPDTTIYKPHQYIDNSGKTECVIFVEKAAKAPPTALWKKGVKILEANEGEIKKGTAIATFDENGNYPKDSKGKHAAIYLSHNKQEKSINVLDQWDSQPIVKQRTIRFWKNKNEKLNGHVYSRSNDSDTFYIIQ